MLKTVCKDAKKHDHPTHKTLDDIVVITQDTSKIYLNEDELDKIKNPAFKRTALDNARDWLLIGCYIGQRVSDLLKLTERNIVIKQGEKYLEVRQKKTRKPVHFPLHPIVEEILNKRDGKFPDNICDPIFNKHIKDVCQIAEINEPVTGAKKINIGTDEDPIWRKENGIFPKWELITSHCCRRSFATNFYSKLPTPVIMSMTGHSTEQQFLEYIGKTANDYEDQIREFFTKQRLKANGQAPMTMLKRAQ